jgi:hypothetical protein
MVDDAIQSANVELNRYAKDSGEYQVTFGDLKRLSNFKARLIDKVRRECKV